MQCISNSRLLWKGWQNVELQNELNQSRQQGAKELAALRCGHAFAGEAKRLLWSARRVARLGARCSRGTGWRGVTTSAEVDGMTLRRRQRRSQTPTIVVENDRAASTQTQLHWMMLMICKGAALNIVFLAGDSEGLEAWRQLTEKY